MQSQFPGSGCFKAKSVKRIGHRGTRISGPRSRNGCATCKKRRIKCDEKRPRCAKCRDSSFACEYATDALGLKDNAKDTVVSLTPLRKPPSVKLFDSDNEYRYFGEFCEKTAMKLTGQCPSSSWSTVVVQASVENSAIRQLVTAIGALDLKQTCTLRRDFVYEQYQKAIHSIRCSFNTTDIRTKLLACLLFVCFESYHGNDEAASTQTLVGIAMANEYTKDHVQDWRNGPPPIDGIILESFTILGQEFNLFHVPYRAQRVIPDYLIRMHKLENGIPEVFTDFSQARVCMLQLFSKHTNAYMVQLQKSFEDQQYEDIYSRVPKPEDILATPDNVPHCQQWQDWSTACKPLLERTRRNFEKTGDKASLDEFLSTNMLRVNFLTYRMIVGSIALRVYKKSMRFTEEATEIITLIKTILSHSEDYWNTESFVFHGQMMSPLMLVGLLYKNRKLRQEALTICSGMSRKEGQWSSEMISMLIRWVIFEEEGDFEDEDCEYVPDEIALRSIHCDVNNVERSVDVKYMQMCDTTTREMELKQVTLSW